jgi:hypothetical protein
MAFNISNEVLTAVGKAAEDAGWSCKESEWPEFHKHVGEAVLKTLLGSTDSGAFLIAAERLDHTVRHGWDLNRDADYVKGELRLASEICQSLSKGANLEFMRSSWPWQSDFGLSFFDKILAKSPIEQLIIAGSFLAAEIDRLNNCGKEEVCPCCEGSCVESQLVGTDENGDFGYLPTCHCCDGSGTKRLNDESAEVQ